MDDDSSRIVPYKEIVGSVSQQTKIGKRKTKAMMDAIVSSIRRHLSDGENVQIPPLGTLFVKKRKGHYVSTGKKGHRGKKFIDGQFYVRLKVNSKIKPEIREADFE